MKKASLIVYPVIIVTCMAIIITFTVIFGCGSVGYSPLYAVLAVIIGTIFEIIIDAIIATIVVLLPKRWFDSTKGWYKVSRKEMLFYKKLGINKWKDWVFAEIGFNKKQVLAPSDKDYVDTFLTETCIAECMHVISVFAGFLLLFIFPAPYILSFPLPIACVNAFLQIPPVLIQRYNRPRLLSLQKWNKKKTVA